MGDSGRACIPTEQEAAAQPSGELQGEFPHSFTHSLIPSFIHSICIKYLLSAEQETRKTKTGNLAYRGFSH